ncbi:MAG: hypothetical protein HZA08_01330 [Nitrospirae bacterium]|nr:hypothetical protein [Nitrospirota bacterium]
MRKKQIKRLLLAGIMTACVAGVTMSGNSFAAEGTNAAEENQAIMILESVRQNYLASVRLESLKSKNTLPSKSHADSPAQAWLKRVKPSEVNMVTNRYTQSEQSAVRMEGKLYFTSGDAYITNLKQNPSIRFAKDPISGRTVDKAEAAIYIDASGRALYFKTDDSFKNFIALADTGTVFGYSQPR